MLSTVGNLFVNDISCGFRELSLEVGESDYKLDINLVDILGKIQYSIKYTKFPKKDQYKFKKIQLQRKYLKKQTYSKPNNNNRYFN